MPINPAGPLTQYRTLIDQNEADIAQHNSDLALINTKINGLSVNEVEVFRAVSNVTQQPSAVDVPLQVTFGAAQSNAYFDLDGAGLFTVLQAGNYSMVLRLVFGRTGSPGLANLYARGIVDGFQTVGSIHAQLDDANQSSSSLFSITGNFPANTNFAVQLLRSSLNGGINVGGLFAQPAPLGDWMASASCSIAITRREVVLGS